MKKLAVIYAGWGQRYVLGHLADDGTDLLFEYAAEALQRGPDLSPLNLPLRAQSFGNFPAHQWRLPGLIADALPDGWGMRLMDKLFRQRGKNPSRVSVLDRLAFIGDTAMGALAFEPAQGDHLDDADVHLAELARQVQEVQNATDGESTGVLRQLVVMGGSPHGARPKVLVNYDPATETMSNSPRGSGTPWLVKFPAQNESAEACAIEAMYARLAIECGISMPATRYFELDAGMAAFGIERFDRQAGMRIPVHTAAGALDADFRLPSVDYTTLLRLTRLMTHDQREVLRAFERCVFNVVFNNHDDHAKNFSFRMGQEQQWKLSPAYDLTFNDGPAGEHQMDICGEGRAPARSDLLRLATDADLPQHDALAVMARCVDVAGQFAETAKIFPITRRTLNPMAARVEANRRRL